MRRQSDLLALTLEAQVVIGRVQLFEEIDPETWLPRSGSRVQTVRGVSLTSMMFRRELFGDLGLIDEEFDAGEDADFIFRMLEARIYYLLEEGIATLYRRHGSNMTSDGERTRRGFMPRLAQIGSSQATAGAR